MNGVPLALLALAPAAAALVLAAPDAGLAGVLVELDEEEEQPAAVSAARARAVSPTPADLPACLRPVELRVIFASFLPGHQAGPGRLISCSRSQAHQNSDIKNLMINR
jgi:hypothetical protein